MSFRGFAKAVVTMAAVWLSLIPASAEAYVRTVNGSGAKVKWGDSCILITAHTHNAPKVLGGAGVLRAVAAAGNIWGRPSYSCTPLTLSTVEEPEAPGVVVNDGFNRVMFNKDRWCRHTPSGDGPCYGRSTLAITTLTARADGIIIDADVEINAVNYRWDDLMVRPKSDGQDLQTVLVHEFGHLTGLDHNCYYPGSPYRGIDENGHVAPECNTASYAVTSTVMYPSASNGSSVKRRLSADETKFVCDVYPMKNPLAPACGEARMVDEPGAEDPGDEAGGCSFGGGAGNGGRSASSALLLALVLLVRRGRRQGRQ